MEAEQLHRKKLKEIGYKDEAIEKLVSRFREQGHYEFAEAYHKELISLSKEENLRNELTIWHPVLEKYRCETCLKWI